MKKLLPDVPVLLSLQPGDHGFEVNCSADDDWVKQGLEFVGRYWPCATSFLGRNSSEQKRTV